MTWQGGNGTRRWIGEPMTEPPAYELAWYRADYHDNCEVCGVPQRTDADRPCCPHCAQTRRQQKTKP